MKKSFTSGLIATALFAACSIASATPPNPNACGNNGNNCNTGGQGGTGGAGGAGGSAIAAAAAQANAGASASNKTDVRNTNTQSQGQGQSQNSSSNSSVKNSGNSASVSGSYSGGNKQTNEGNNATTTVSVGGDTYAAQERAPVSTAYAAGLTASNGTCFGSASGGVQAVSFGVTVGSTVMDDGCDARYDSAALAALGLRDAAQARLCQRPGNRQAMADAGTPCKTAKAAAAPTGATVATAPTTQAQHTDPIIRKRLGLPPL